MRLWRGFWSAKEQGGQAVVLIAISFMAMLFAVGLAIDAGQLFTAKRTEQEAADAAAFAGAIQLYLGGTAAQAKAAAIADATLNGYTDTVNGASVVVNVPPTNGNFVDDALSVEVIIIVQTKTVLVPAQSSITAVRARSVGQSSPFRSPFAIMTLNSGQGPCVSVTNTGGIVVPNGPGLGGAVQANCSGTGMDLSGAGGITDPLGVYSVGPVTPASRVTGPIVQPYPVQRDPFAGFPKPPIGTIQQASGPYYVPATACNPATPLPAGTYIGGLINNNNCATVWLDTGVFILKGGGLNQNAQTGNTISTLPGGGAMIFNTHSRYQDPLPTGTCGDIQAQQGGKIDITAMTLAQSPQYAGMGLYQDAICTNSIVIASNGALNIHGTLYAPKAQLQLASQSAGTIDAQIVVDTINVSSSGNLTVNYRPAASAQTNLPSLVE